MHTEDRVFAGSTASHMMKVSPPGSQNVITLNEYLRHVHDLYPWIISQITPVRLYM